MDDEKNKSVKVGGVDGPSTDGPKPEPGTKGYKKRVRQFRPGTVIRQRSGARYQVTESGAWRRLK